MVDNVLECDDAIRRVRWTERFPLFEHNPIFGLACTLAIVGTAWLFRIAADTWLPSGYPYITFFPAVIITSFLFGVRLGSLSAVLCGLIAWYCFVGPGETFSTDGVEVALAFYVFVVGTDLLLVHGMQSASKQLIKEREISLNLAKAKARILDELKLGMAEKKQAIADLEDSEITTQLATETAGIGLWRWHVQSGRIHWDHAMFEIYGISPTVDSFLKYSDYIGRVHPDDAADQDAVLRDTVTRCGTSTREFRIWRKSDNKIRHIRAVEIARADLHGQTQWVVGTNLDVTEQKDRERHVQFLMGEINHRAKNLLAVVMSVAHQTGGAANAEFVRKFSARIQSLSASQDVLVESKWTSAEMENLVRAQLDHFKDLIGCRITLGGDMVYLSPAAVQTIGMALHELTTNASKYGALSNDTGRVAITWQHEPGVASGRLVMNWNEFDGPSVVAPQRKGFGSTVTGEVVRMSLGAQITTDFSSTGFSWQLDCPIENVIDDQCKMCREIGEICAPKTKLPSRCTFRRSQISSV
jgi:two-component sensor histidine kinase